MHRYLNNEVKRKSVKRSLSLLIVGLFLLLPLHTSVAQSGWFHIPISEGIYSLNFIDTLTGWAGMDSGIKKTTDGGETWNLQYANGNNPFFLDKNIGFATGGVGEIVKTTDGGINWIKKQINVSTYFHKIYFYDSHLGFAVSDSVIAKTTDQGDTWETKVVPAYYLYDISFGSSTYGWAIGNYNSCVKTTDGGVTWVQVYPTPINDVQLTGVQFLTVSKAVIAGGSIVLTTDGGDTWGTKFTGTSWLKFAFCDSLYGLAIGAYSILKTTDGGVKWTTEIFPSPQRYLTCVSGVDISHFWIAGDKVLLRTSGSIVGIEQSEYELLTKYQLSQNYPNPFNPTTNISFSIPSRSFVSLKIFDLLGREVSTIVSNELSAGNYTREWNAKGFPSGIYFYRLQSGKDVMTKKLMLLK